MRESNSREITLSDFERKKLVEQIYITFPRLNRVYSLVEHCHQHSKIAAEPECLLITGQQGAGKTTLRRTWPHGREAAISGNKSASHPKQTLARGPLKLLSDIGNKQSQKRTRLSTPSITSL